MDKKSEILTFSVSSLSNTLTGIQGCDEFSQFVNVFVSIVFFETVQYILREPYCAFSKCSRSLIHCRLNLYSFSFAKYLKVSSNSHSLPLSNQNFLGRFFFVLMVKNARTFSLESFVFIPFAYTVLSNTSWRTSRYITRLLSLANLSTYARSTPKNLLLNLAKIFILLKLRVARVSFVWESSECKTLCHLWEW